MYLLRISPRILFILTISNSFLSTAESTELATCYFPDSTIATNFVACSPTEDGSCCEHGDLCTQYGYCVSQSKGYHYRGACTDGSWGNPSCPDYCLGSSSGNSTYVDVIACNAASTDGSWCCAYDGDCCSSSSTFVPGFGTMFTEPNAAATSTTSSSSSSTSTSTFTTTTSSKSASQSSTAAATSTASANTTSSATSSNTNNSKSTIIGAAVGIPLGLAACAGLFLFYRERRRRINAETMGPAKLNDGGISSPNGWYGQLDPKPTYEMNGGSAAHELQSPSQ